MACSFIHSFICKCGVSSFHFHLLFLKPSECSEIIICTPFMVRLIDINLKVLKATESMKAEPLGPFCLVLPPSPRWWWLSFSPVSLLLLLCSSLPGPCRRRMNPSSADSPAPRGGRVQGEAAASWLEQVYSPRVPTGPLSALGCRPETDGEKLPPSSLSFHSSFFRSPSTCARLLRCLQSIPRGPLCLGWLAAATNHTQETQMHAGAAMCDQTNAEGVGAGEGWGGKTDRTGIVMFFVCVTS